jgi:quercetin dioxygenase-like cupin family protein
MNVIEQARPASVGMPGIAHATWAGSADGLTQVSVWRQTLAPGAATPPHSHDCDEVVMCQSGLGELHADGEVQRFGGDSTIALPRGKVHQIFNVGETPLELLAALGGTPVGTFLPDGEAIALPWRT